MANLFRFYNHLSDNQKRALDLLGILLMVLGCWKASELPIWLFKHISIDLVP
jgi:hypothetical protein